MTPPPPSRRTGFVVAALVLLCHLADGAARTLRAQAPGRAPSSATNLTQVIAIQGTNYWVAPRGADDWVLASTQVPQNVRIGDRIRTGRDTRLFLRTPHLGVIQIPPLSTVEISAPPGDAKSIWVRILDGMIYFFHRGSPSDVEVQTRGASAAIRGTEFVAEARADGGLIIRLVDGAVALRNDQGSVLLHKGEEGMAAAGQIPTQSPALYANRVIQWCLYYPAVVDVNEVPLSIQEMNVLADSLTAYRAGDLVAALARYPDGRQPESAAERVYLAGLWLAIGQVQQTETLLEPLAASGVPGRLAAAIRLMIAATRAQARPAAPAPPELASEWLAESYYRQAEGDLTGAREAARQATLKAPGFGFAWARLAELEFGFGRLEAASEALRTALPLAPRHAAAVALEGFQWCARNQIAAAESSFNHALELDPGFGNAWLGRGLCRIRRGEVTLGLEDLEVAAAAEPQRALLRSYLGKAFAEAGDSRRAEKELTLAKSLDPNDPSSWLYAALLDQQQNRINDGIRNLETSKRLNENRSLYRSRHLLDEDQAVRGANLSAIYRDAGFIDLSRREAVDAVNSDYANYSAHLFLANTYNELRDPSQVDLRYETAWFTEFLLANLLGPVGAGTLSQTVSAQEFSRLFERDGLGFVSETEYRSNGDWIQSAAQYGLLGNFAYALEADYRSNNGQRRNSDVEQLTLGLKLKQQLGPKDSFYFQAVYYDADGGDAARVYDPKDPAYFHPGYRFEENQEPLLLGGYHHQWGPGQHTLALVGRIHDRLHVTDPTQPVLLVGKDTNDVVTGTILTSAEQRYLSELEIYSAELQHIAQIDPWTFVLGGRSQFGQFDTENHQQNLADQTAALPVPLSQDIGNDLRRFSAYGYAQWEVVEPFFLFGGLSYDYLQYPENYRFAPLSSGEQTRDQWSPKGGFLWKITPNSTLRGAYTRSLSGASLEQSVRLEPSQVAGFNQAWRSLIPESVVGAQAGARLESGSLEWDYRFPTETYLAVRGDVNRSRLRRQVGVFDLEFLAEPSTTPEKLDFREHSLNITLNQLLGKGLALGAHYRLSNAQLEDDYPQIPGTVPAFFPPYELRPHQDLESTLHQVLLFAVYNHASGCFGRFESLWSSQSNQGYQPARPGDAFWQLNAFVGYRFPRRRAEVQLGLLNLTDQDYRLNPLNLTPELPRQRTFTASLRLNF
ncbi:MAG TPA: TonB-dependent receptor [Verrucomicrobiae bacterium]|nr:TonB-dependent receptor [Verrucomicrobiae bacterium]